MAAKIVNTYTCTSVRKSIPAMGLSLVRGQTVAAEEGDPRDIALKRLVGRGFSGPVPSSSAAHIKSAAQGQAAAINAATATAEARASDADARASKAEALISELEVDKLRLASEKVSADDAVKALLAENHDLKSGLASSQERLTEITEARDHIVAEHAEMSELLTAASDETKNAHSELERAKNLLTDAGRKKFDAGK